MRSVILRQRIREAALDAFQERGDLCAAIDAAIDQSLRASAALIRAHQRAGTNDLSAIEREVAALAETVGVDHG